MAGCTEADTTAVSPARHVLQKSGIPGGPDKPHLHQFPPSLVLRRGRGGGLASGNREVLREGRDEGEEVEGHLADEVVGDALDANATTQQQKALVAAYAKKKSRK